MWPAKQHSVPGVVLAANRKEKSTLSIFGGCLLILDLQLRSLLLLSTLQTGHLLEEFSDQLDLGTCKLRKHRCVNLRGYTVHQ
jgi:hypothetical protein